jgi:hypothetical protein
MRFVGREKTISERLYQERAFDRPWRYSTTVELHGYSEKTGEKQTRHVTVTHDTLMHREELEASALQTMDEASPDFVLETLMPVEGYRRV